MCMSCWHEDGCRLAASIDKALRDYTVSRDAMRWTTEPFTPQPEVFEGLARATRSLAEAVGKLFAGLRRRVSLQGRALHGLAHVKGVSVSPVGRCAICRPKANTRPSAHGRAYRQRQLARRRRRRSS